MEDRAAEGTLLGIVRRCLGITAVERYLEQQEGLVATKQGGAGKLKGTSISPIG
jgi:hypothetical protein